KNLFLLVSYYSFVVKSLVDAMCKELGVSFTTLPLNMEKDSPVEVSKDIFPHSWFTINNQSLARFSDLVLSHVDDFAEILGELESNDLLKPLFEDIIPRKLRHLLGEYYTPRYLAESILETLPSTDIHDKIILDPACGSGVFLMACIRQKKRSLALQGAQSSDSLDLITSSVIGIDINPIAVISARFNYIMAVKDLILEENGNTINIPVYFADSVQVSGINNEIGSNKFLTPLLRNIDVLVGNPPWISWGHLTDELRTKWKETHVGKYNLLQYSGKFARLGYSNDDISVPFIWVSMDKYLKKGGIAGFVLKRTLLKGSSGKLFRSMKITKTGEKIREISVHSIHDWGNFEPFGKGIGAETSTVVMQLDRPNKFPVEYTIWEPTSERDFTPHSSFQDIIQFLKHRETGLTPLDDSHDAPWIDLDHNLSVLGECSYDIRHGAKDDLKSVFEISQSKIKEIEPDFIYPYLKSKDIVRWGTLSYSYRIIPQKKSGETNEIFLQNNLPMTYKYLVANRQALEKRKSTWLKTGPFYSVFGVGNYTWSKYKVAWCRLGFRPEFCVISTENDSILGEKSLIPGDHFMFIPFDNKEEAHAICALLNSTPYIETLGGISHKSKSALSKKVVSSLSLPKFSDIESGKELANLSLQAHRLVGQTIKLNAPDSRREYREPVVVGDIQSAIDSIVSDFLK
ncbi:MAG: Eco57I restriction-modification methylase domain-containing protein, partial [Candidatus Thorarchaeota archaeon]